MSVTDEQLLALSEGRLDSADAVALRAVVAESPDATERLKLIEQAGQALNKAPAPDQSGLETLADAIRSGRLDPETVTLDHATPGKRSPLAPKRFASVWSPIQMAACVAALLVGLCAGYWGAGHSTSNRTTTTADQPAWVVRVVDYHTLYSRETVAPSKISPNEVAGLQQRFEEALSARMHIPLLDGRALDFRRGQILRFKQTPVIQLAYLPERSGAPVALCLKPTKKPDSKPVYVTVRGMGVVRWRQSGLSYVLVGHRSEANLLADAAQASREIAASETI